MKKFLANFAEAALLCTLLVQLLLLFLQLQGQGWTATDRARRKLESGNTARSIFSAQDVSEEDQCISAGRRTVPGDVAEVTASADPVRIARLFGWKPPVVKAPPEAVPEVECKDVTPLPEPATFLTLVGTVRQADGTVEHFLRNATNGRVEKASSAESAQWKLLEEKDNALILQRDERKYLLEVKQ